MRSSGIQADESQARPAGPLYLGIDAGGSKTASVVVSQDGCVLGAGSGPAANLSHVEPGACHAAIAAARDSALAMCGAAVHQLVGACVCMAGFEPHMEQSVARSLLGDILPQQTVFLQDLHAALASVSGSGPGLVVIAGTGSVAYGRNAAGQTARAGGWGYLLGDEGSAYYLGSRALSHAFRAFDGRESRGLLFDGVANRAGVDSAEALDRAIYRDRWTPAQIAAFAPLVFEAAGQGDPTAADLIAQAARHLADLVCAVAGRLELVSAACGLVGGLWSAGTVLRQPFQAAVSARFSGLRFSEPAISPAAGAALLALHQAGIELSPAQLFRPAGVPADEFSGNGSTQPT